MNESLYFNKDLSIKNQIKSKLSCTIQSKQRFLSETTTNIPSQLNLKTPNESSITTDEPQTSIKSPQTTSQHVSNWQLNLPDSMQKKKRMRTSFKHQQLRIMKAYFQLNQNPDSKELKELSDRTSLSKRTLQVWFQNSRAKQRKATITTSVSNSQETLKNHSASIIKFDYDYDDQDDNDDYDDCKSGDDDDDDEENNENLVNDINNNDKQMDNLSICLYNGIEIGENNMVTTAANNGVQQYYY